MNFWDWLIRCRGCEARDSHILSLKEQLKEERERLDYALIPKTESIQQQSAPALHSIPHKTGIYDKIRRAEAHDRKEAEPLIAQRKREFDARIAMLEKPEIEVQDGA